MDTYLLSLSDQQTIAQQVFQIMAGIDVFACDCPPLEENGVLTMLTFREGTLGAILIDCSRGMAYAFTSGLMAIDLPTSVDDDVLDAMRELVNMIGGNLKGLLPASTYISMPSVLSSKQRGELLAEMELVSDFCICCADGHCRINFLTPVIHIPDSKNSVLADRSTALLVEPRIESVEVNPYHEWKPSCES